MPAKNPKNLPDINDPISAMAQARSKRLWRTILRVFLIVAFALVMIRLIWGYTAANDLNKAAKAVADRGEPLRMEDIARPAPAADDGWPIYKDLLESAAREGVGATYLVDEKSPKPVSADLQARLSKDKPDHELMTRLWQDLSLRHDPAVAAQLRDRLAQHARFLAQLRLASEKPRVAWPIGDNPYKVDDPYLTPLPRLHQFLLMRALVTCDEGRKEEALADVSAAIRIGRQFGSMPILQGCIGEFTLTQSALAALQEMMRQIDSAALSAPLAEIQQELLSGNDNAAVKQSLLSNRAMLYSMYQRVVNNQPMFSSTAGANGSPDWFTCFLVWAARPYIDANEANTLRLYERILPLADLPYFQMAGTLGPLTSEMASAGATRAWACDNFVLFLNMLMTSTNTRANCDLAAVAVAAKRYQLEQGQFPARLELLVPRYLSHLPVNLVTGGALEYLPENKYPHVGGAGLTAAKNSLVLSKQDIYFYLSSIPAPTTSTAPASTAPSQPAS